MTASSQNPNFFGLNADLSNMEGGRRKCLGVGAAGRLVDELRRVMRERTPGSEDFDDEDSLGATDLDAGIVSLAVWD